MIMLENILEEMLRIENPTPAQINQITQLTIAVSLKNMGDQLEEISSGLESVAQAIEDLDFYEGEQ